jgi:hypothetical protein
MNPKFIIVSAPEAPLIGTFVYGIVGQHKELVRGYVKIHGGGWYHKDDRNKTLKLYGSSGDYAKANDLNVSYYQDYGWPAVKIED